MNTVNVCGVCREELLTRKEVETLVKGEKQVTLHRAHMRRDIYFCGRAFVYAEFQGVTGSLGETKNIACKCMVKEGVTPSMTMIREEYRGVFAEKFGTEYTVPFLFRIPVEVVAWENSGLVGFESSSDGLKVSERGQRLIDMIADMSKEGLFVGGIANYTERDVVAGFSYLHMVKPAYRTLAALAFGASVSIQRFFSTVSMDWIDWQVFLTLKCEVTAGLLQVSRVRGVSLLAEVTTDLSRALRVRSGGVKSLVTGSFVTKDDACFQIMPGLVFFDGSRGARCDAAAVILHEGQAFIPSGYMVLKTLKRPLAVTFEPGVSVELEDGTVLRNSRGSVVLFVDGVVQLRVLPIGDGLVDDVSSSQYSVHVNCESFAQGTRLKRWYDARFDLTSVDARFYALTAKVLLLYSPGVAEKPGIRAKVSEKATLIDEGVGYFELSAAGTGERVVALDVSMPSTLTRVGYVGGTAGVWVDDVVGVNAYSQVGLLGPTVMVFDVEPKSLVGQRGEGFSRAMTACVAVVSDADEFDDGDSSDSEVMGYELATWKRYSPLDILHVYAVVGRYPQYCGVAKHPGDLAWQLGAQPTFKQLMAVSADLIDLQKLDDTGWVFSSSEHWRLVDKAEATSTWRDAVVSSVAQLTREYHVSGSLAYVLCERFGVATRYPSSSDVLV